MPKFPLNDMKATRRKGGACGGENSECDVRKGRMKLPKRVRQVEARGAERKTAKQ